MFHSLLLILQVVPGGHPLSSGGSPRPDKKTIYSVIYPEIKSKSRGKKKKVNPRGTVFPKRKDRFSPDGGNHSASLMPVRLETCWR
jgi:hypothetical protein